MKLSKNARMGILCCGLAVVVFVLYAILISGLVDALEAGYDQIVIDFGNPK